MKVREILTFYGGLKRNGDVRREVDQWLERLDLVDWANKKVETLSKGIRITSYNVCYTKLLRSHGQTSRIDVLLHDK